MKRFLITLVVCLSLILPTTQVIYADNDFSTALEGYLKRTPSEEDIHNFSLIITTLKTEGLSNEGIAGVLGNVAVEGGAGSIFAIEGYGGKTCNTGEKYTEFKVGSSYDYGDTKPSLSTSKKTGKTMGGEGHGICQWSFGRATGMSDFAGKNSDFGHVTVKHWVKDYDSGWFQGTYNIPDIAGQVLWMMEEMNTSYTSTKEDMKKATDARDAAKSFHDSYEGSNGYTSDRADYAELALVAVNACTGVEGSSSVNSSGNTDSEAVAKQMESMGYWSEDQLSSFIRLSEPDIQSEYLDNAKRSNLDQSSLEGLANWERNIKNDKEEDGFIAVLRKIIMLMGIVLILWSIFIYLAYWFDCINSIIFINALGLLTFGMLHISGTEEECTFFADKSGKAKGKTVNHKAILYICGVALLFGILIITGTLYKLISVFVNLVQRVVG